MKMIDLYYFIHNTCYYQWISVICKYFSQNSVLFSLFLLTHRIRKNCIHNLMAIADSSFTALLLVTLVCSVNTDCPLSYYPRQTTIGYIRADIDSSSANQNLPQIYQYPLVDQLRGSTSSRTVVGVTGLSLDKKSSQFGYKIQLPPSRLPTSTVVFKVSVLKGQNNDRWRYIMFTFIVSQTPELLLGTKNILQFIPTSDPNALKVMELIPMPSLNFNYRVTSKIFVSGVQIKQKISLSAQSLSKLDETIRQLKGLEKYSWNIKLINRFTKIVSTNKIPSFSLSQPQFTQNGLLSFEVRLSQMQIKQFIFSYVIYVQKMNSDILYQTISGSFTFSDQQDTYSYKQLDNDAMKIIGLTGFAYSSDQIGIISLEIQNGKKNELNFFSGKIQGLYSQFKLSFFGISTLPGAVCRSCLGSPLIFEQFCVSECPRGFVSSINSDGSFYCHQCNLQNFLIARDDKQSCVCASGHYLISPTQQCDRCPYDCLTCNGNVCLTCDTLIPSTYRVLNVKTGRCQCQANYMGLSLFDDINGQTRKCVTCNPRCKTCHGPQISNCLSCAPYRTLSNGICRCEQNFVEDRNGQCACIAPYALSRNGICSLSQNKCKQNQKLVMLPSGEKACSCMPGYIRSIVSNICIKQCQSFQEFNYETQACECRHGCAHDSGTKMCIECSSKLNQIYDEQTKQCGCIEGFEMNRTGECIMCPPKTYYNPNTDSCECIFNFYKSGYTCLKCRNQWDSPACRRLAVNPRMQL